MALMRPWTRRLLDLVDAGVVDLDALIEQAMPSVPLGHAYRVREQRNDRMRRVNRAANPQGVPRATRPTPTTTEIHQIGARIVLRSSVHMLIRKGHLVRTGDHVCRPSQATRSARRPEDAS